MKIKNIIKSKNFWKFLLMLTVSVLLFLLPIIVGTVNTTSYCIGAFAGTVFNSLLDKAFAYVPKEVKKDDSVSSAL